MKKAISFLLAVMLTVCAACALPSVAFAEGLNTGESGGEEKPVENVNLAIKSYSPTSMVSGGDVTLDIAITNGGSDIQNAKLKIGGNTVADYGTITAGSTESYKNSYNVSSDRLDKDIEVELQYTFNGDQRSKKSSFKVAKKAASVNVSTAVKADKTEVESGGKVKLTFAIENKGNVKIENATITASELNKGKSICSAFSVEAGNSKVVTYSATITINVDEVLLSVVASVSNAYPAADEEINFTIAMTNSGNVDMQKLALTASNGETIALSSTKLPAGGTLEAKVPITLEESGILSFKLKAEDAAGKESTYTSTPINIVVQEKPAQDYTGKLSLIVTADTSAYKKENLIKFTLTLKNETDATFTDVALTEDSIGDLGLGTIAALYPGETSYTYELKAELDGHKTYYFKMTGVDPDGYTVMVSANAIEVEVNPKKSNGLGALLWIVIIIVLLLIGGGVTLLVLIGKEKKAQAAEKEAQERPVVRRAVVRTPQQAAEPVEAPVQAPEELPEEPESPEEAPAEEPVERALPRDMEIEPMEEKPEIEEFPQRKRGKPATPKRINRSSDFVDRNNF